MTIDRIKKSTRNIVDKLFNTLIWLLYPKNEVIVLNVWLRHKGRSVRIYNFGDDINYVIVDYLSHKKIISYMHSYVSLFNPINYMCIGSIVDVLTNEKSIIWGGGALCGDRNRKITTPEKVFAVRGPLTREYLLSQGIECPQIYGDPAILLPYIYPCKRKKKYRIGLIPHYIDYNLDIVSSFIEKYGDSSVVINLKEYNNWKDVVNTINECDCIASSSLHGLIVADAYNVPNIWIKMSQNVKGNDFKFKDYFEGCKKYNITPYEFRTIINIDEFINEICSRYVKPQYDIRSLLIACPFVVNKKSS